MVPPRIFHLTGTHKTHGFARIKQGQIREQEINGFFKMDYTELQVTTNFSFLRGASHPEEMIE
ncbi:MAG: hypothetical protein ABFD10_10140, partial [Prolixibacteraceae bacterium]